MKINIFKSARFKASISQAVAKKKLNITQEELDLIEEGKAEPCIKLLIKMSKLYKIGLDNMLNPRGEFCSIKRSQKENATIALIEYLHVLSDENYDPEFKPTYSITNNGGEIKAIFNSVNAEIHKD